MNLEFLEIGIILNLEFFWNWNLWNYSFISRFNYQDITEVVGNCLELELFGIGIVLEFGIF